MSINKANFYFLLKNMNGYEIIWKIVFDSCGYSAKRISNHELHK